MDARRDMTESIDALVAQLEDLCGSESISLEALKYITKPIPLNTVRNSPFLHKACANKNITIEMVEYLIAFAPESVKFRSDAFILLSDDLFGDFQRQKNPRKNA